MIQIILIALISLLAQLVLPWWSVAVVAFGVCFWRGPASRSSGGSKAFVHGFVGVALVWLAYALLIHFRTDGIFTSRMSQLLFKSSSASIPLVVAPLLGGLVGGLAGLSGYLTRRATGNQIEHRTT